MLSIEVAKNNQSFIEEIKINFPDCIVIEVNSFGADSIVQIIIPLAAILAPVIAPVITKALTDSSITVKYDGIEVSGDYKKVKALIEQIEAKREKKNESR